MERSLAEGLQDYGNKCEEGRVVRRKLHIEKLRDLYSSLHIARFSKYKNTSSVGRRHVWGEKRFFHGFGEKLAGKRQFARSRYRREDNKSESRMLRCRMDYSGLG